MIGKKGKYPFLPDRFYGSFSYRMAERVPEFFLPAKNE